MGLNLIYNDGQTPLDEDEKEGLLIKSISTRGELDEFEQQNIEDAIQWSLTRKFKQEQILSETFIQDLHKKMYGRVWSWAGEYRKTNKNIGVDKLEIPTALRSLIDDAKYWLEHNVYEPDEFAIRFKHRLVSMHCFPNGNGRHSRMMADMIIEKIYQQSVFSWGGASISEDTDIRAQYLKAIRKADKGDFDLLLKFARS
ncbi:mobile mystery protein B [Sediminibacterium sp.]|uniref:mobile mystery protein B n=1 Tax=Sediminibacterium sp. TaxID=1917865 RepID=UPI0027375E13|nr:mobile mystery protein B [Sediminibacterium sp.]MDP3393048.1 mobile mystery protein B [Sediminibacterium sp.]MDP3567256.1 mobile mystery protein B [Sediminibacterium sp.]